jgi:hypothetical protein
MQQKNLEPVPKADSLSRGNRLGRKPPRSKLEKEFLSDFAVETTIKSERSTMPCMVGGITVQYDQAQVFEDIESISPYMFGDIRSVQGT